MWLYLPSLYNIERVDIITYILKNNRKKFRGLWCILLFNSIGLTDYKFIIVRNYFIRFLEQYPCQDFRATLTWSLSSCLLTNKVHMLEPPPQSTNLKVEQI